MAFLKSSQLEVTAAMGTFVPGTGVEQRMGEYCWRQLSLSLLSTVEGRKLKAGITIRPSQSGERYRQLDGGL